MIYFIPLFILFYDFMRMMDERRGFMNSTNANGGCSVLKDSMDFYVMVTSIYLFFESFCLLLSMFMIRDFFWGLMEKEYSRSMRRWGEGTFVL